jgi:hypothetical protein
MSFSKKTMTVCLITLSFFAVSAINTWAMPSVYPTGTTIFYPDKASPNQVLLYPNDPVPGVVIVDRMGNVIHKWDVSSGRVRLTPQGNLFAAVLNEKKKIINIYREYDWDGKVVWEYELPFGVFKNDFQWLDNGNLLLSVQIPLPPEALAKIKDVAVLPWWGMRKRSAKQNGDAIIEVNREKKIVWEWYWHEHADVNRFSPETPVDDWTHQNTVNILPENKWYDAGDNRFKPGNIIVNPRNFDEIFIIDKETKNIVWSWTTNYNGGLAHPHEPSMIAKGLPGEGNIILLDNGLFPKFRHHSGQSIIWEVNPSTKEVVWKYETTGYSNQRFFTKTKGSVKRLPNGNTYISECVTGRAFEVRTDKNHPDGGEIVWEYIAPDTAFSRARLYPVDYCPQIKPLLKAKETPIIPPKGMFHDYTRHTPGL